MIANSDWLKYQSKQFPDNSAIVSSKLKLTYSGLDERVNNAARSLYNSGISSGEYVPVIIGHQVELIVAVFGLWRIGAVPVLLSPHLPVTEYDNIINKLIPSSCILGASAGYKNDKLKFINVEFPRESRIEIISRWAEDIEKPALILYTSGSIGTSKGVIISFASLFNSFININEFDNYTTGDKFLASLPLHHIGGFSIIIRALLSGGKLILPGNVSYADIAKNMQKFDPTIISLVPTNLKRLIENRIKPNDSLRSVYLGGGPAPYALVDGAVKMNYPIIKVYGSTETCSMVSAVRINNPNEYNSSGKPLKNANIIIRSEEQLYVDKNMIGEILVKSNSLFSGYLDYDEGKGNRLRDGYFSTGDYGYMDAQGLLHIVMRREDLIVSGGENINPVEIQDALNSIAGIKESYVIGIDDEEWGQIVVSFIVTDCAFDEPLIKSKLKILLAPYKVPKRFIKIESLPKTGLGKVNRQALIKFFHQDL
jgi:O-succinylbenzoic acid--CoA ligase